MSLIETPYRSDAWPAVTGFLESATDPVRDLLVWADVASSLGSESRIWRLESGGRVRALAFAFPIWERLSAVGVKGLRREDERAALGAIARRIPEGYVITDPAQTPLYAETGRLSDPGREVHMTLASTAWRDVPTPGVRPASFEEVDRFYRTHGAGAWNPVQYATGPYVVAEEAGEVVAAAGTHFRYEALAQIGNVLTAPDHRGRGHARRVTAAVARALAEAGTPTLSLFVAEANAPARRVYEALGFQPLRTLDTFHWHP